MTGEAVRKYVAKIAAGILGFWGGLWVLLSILNILHDHFTGTLTKYDSGNWILLGFMTVFGIWFISIAVIVIRLYSAKGIRSLASLFGFVIYGIFMGAGKSYWATNQGFTIALVIGLICGYAAYRIICRIYAAELKPAKPVEAPSS